MSAGSTASGAEDLVLQREVVGSAGPASDLNPGATTQRPEWRRPSLGHHWGRADELGASGERDLRAGGGLLAA